MSLQEIKRLVDAGRSYNTKLRLKPGFTGIVVTVYGEHYPARYIASVPYWLSKARKHALFIPRHLLNTECVPAGAVPVICEAPDGRQIRTLEDANLYASSLVVTGDISLNALGVELHRVGFNLYAVELYSTVTKPGWHNGTVRVRLTTSNKKEIPMNDLSAVLFGEKLFSVAVQFRNSSKVYNYKSTKPYEAGDRVVVDSPSEGLVVVTVCECKQGLEVHSQPFETFKWIVDKVDTTAYNNLLAAEADFLQKAKLAEQRRKAIARLAELGVTPEDYELAILGGSK